MKDLYLVIKNMKKGLLLSIIILFCIIEAFSIFPLSLKLSITTLIVIYCYIMLGVILHAAYNNHLIFISTLVFLSNTVGLLLRLWIEYKNEQVTQLLNLENILVAYLPVLLVLLGYKMTNNFILNSKNSNIFK